MVESENRYHFYEVNFSRQETLLHGQKRFLYSKGPKNVLCLFIEVDTKHCKNVGAMFCIEPEKRQSAFLGPLEWRNLFRPSNKVSSNEKPV